MPFPLSAIDHRYRDAMACNACFGTVLHLDRGSADLPQPGWIGPRYGSSSPRVAVLLVNPASARRKGKDRLKEPLRNSLQQYKDGNMPLLDLFAVQKKQMSQWGQGQFISFYEKYAGPIEALAFLDLALCATKRNQCPRDMRRLCFGSHSGNIIELLAPDILLMSGTKTHFLKDEIQHRLPECRLIRILHFAHRTGKHIEQKDIRRARKWLVREWKPTTK